MLKKQPVLRRKYASASIDTSHCNLRTDISSFLSSVFFRTTILQLLAFGEKVSRQINHSKTTKSTTSENLAFQSHREGTVEK